MPSCQTDAELSSDVDQNVYDNSRILLGMLRHVKDFRGTQGRMYELGFVLAVAVVATLAGATNYRQLGSQAADLPQNLLARLGARYDHFTGRYAAPS
ncbi:transposase family protein [Frankia sp. KB5]|uniref:transposase family protein n=1 Tax=Frankia sp. KB5 TaxID=683318 RepID=UPI000E2F5F17|nr:transposase family protein [Frankia sp. KB5]